MTIITPNLTFESESHTYRLRGREVPSVTTILQAEGIIDTTYYTDDGRDRGTAVHAAIHYAAEGDLDPTSIDPAIEPYLEAHRLFMATSGFEVYASEVSLATDKWGGFAGTFDLLGWWRGEGRVSILDCKTGAFDPIAHPLQLAAYRLLLLDNLQYLGLRLSDVALGCAVIELRKDGTPNARLVEDVRTAEYKFLAVLATHTMKRKVA